MRCNFEPLVGFEMTYLDFLGAHDHLWNLARGVFRFGVILMSQRSRLPKNRLAFVGLLWKHVTHCGSQELDYVQNLQLSLLPHT